MSTKRISEIKKAISLNDVSSARKLISSALKNEPDADIYYLASQVALDDNQKKEFLNKALEIDPFHEDANNLLSDEPLEIKSSPKVKKADKSENSKPKKTEEINKIVESSTSITKSSEEHLTSGTEEEHLTSGTEEEPLLAYILSFPAWVRISIGLISGLIMGKIANSVTGYNPNATGWAALYETDFVSIYTIIFGISGLILSTRKNPLAFIAGGFLLGGSIGGSIGGSRDGSTDVFFLLGAFGVLVGTIASRAFTWFSAQQDNLKRPQTVEQSPTLAENTETNSAQIKLELLPEKMLCPKCAEKVILEEKERIERNFICPHCNNFIDVNL